MRATAPTLEQRVRRVVLDMAPLPVAYVSGAQRLGGDLGYDSLGRLELAFALEREFDLRTIDGHEAIGVRTIADVESLVARLSAQDAVR